MSQPVASTQRCGRIGNGCIRVAFEKGNGFNMKFVHL